MSTESENHSFIPAHGGYREQLSYQKAEVVYDLTFRFCQRFLQKGDRTIDQMVQAAHSGKQNIAEGTHASGTSKETELMLLSNFLRPNGPPVQRPHQAHKLPPGAKKLAILYYPKIAWLEQRICRIGLFVSLITGSAFAVLSLIYHWSYTPGYIVMMAFLAYASIWFATKGSLGAGTEIALFFDPKRRDEYWAWWFALIGLIYGICFFLCGIAWLWMLRHVTPG